jgi:uncharacterized protein (TIRG00374 family)
VSAMESKLAPKAPARRSWLRDWRVWLGVAITAACLWYMLRDVPLREVQAAMAKADLPLLFGVSLPAYLLNVWLRALRWRHLTNPVALISRGTLYRAQAIGFMANNLVPLRIGELVRSWYLARECRVSGAAILGTVVLERVLDIVAVPLIAALALVFLGAGADDGGLISQGWKFLVPLAVLPLVALLLLRAAPDFVLAIVRAFTRPLPEASGEWLEQAIRRFADGLGALSGGWHLFWIVFHTTTIWLVASTIPILAAVVAFHLELGSSLQTLVVSWILLGASGVAVAIPSAPGFFGPYQLAYKEVLERFGIDSATALGVGLVVWAVFWVCLTVQGLVVMRITHASLGELTHEPGKALPPEDR